MRVVEFLLSTLDSSNTDAVNKAIDGRIKTKYLPVPLKHSIAQAVYNAVATDTSGSPQVDNYTKNIFLSILLITLYTDLEFDKDANGSLTQMALKEYELLQKDGLDKKIFAAVGDDYQETLQAVDCYFRDRLQPAAAPRPRRQGGLHKGPIQEFGFRELNHKFFLLLTDELSPAAKAARLMLNARPRDNALLVYGYIDESAGLSFEALCSAQYRAAQNAINLAPANPASSLKIRYDSMAGTLVSINEAMQFPQFRKQVEIISRSYAVSDAVEATRKIAEIDPLRHPQFPDDVMVYLMKQGYQNEGVWMRLKASQGSVFSGKLLNEPHQDFGCHAGGDIRAQLVKQGNDILLVVLV